MAVAPTRHRLIGLFIAGVLLAGCQPADPISDDADIIVAGAGVAGLAAALEAEAQGAIVLVMDVNSVPGGQAVKAEHLALADTPLQQAHRLSDSPAAAYRDFMAWSEDADPWWTRHYANHSRTEVHDWLTGLGVEFTRLSAAPEATIARLHATRGSATHIVVAMMAEALRRPGIHFHWNTRVTQLLRHDGRISGVRTRHSRSGEERTWRSGAVILATGGFSADTGKTAKDRESLSLYATGPYATGSALQLTNSFGAAYFGLERQDISIDGLPDPRWPGHGLLVDNPDAIRVDAAGRRFTNEAASAKVILRAALELSPATHWLIFDAIGARQFSASGSPWLRDADATQQLLDNPALVKKAGSIGELASAAGLPPDALAETVQRFNRFVDQGMDTDFGRIGPGTTMSRPSALRHPPFYAVQLFPMARASLGGLIVDREARVLGGAGQVLRGLFAAGEATGAGGINGSHAGEGRMLGLSILQGRIAGRQAAALVTTAADTALTPELAAHDASSDREAQQQATDDVGLAALLDRQRPGYWHFDVSHGLVMERDDSCESCHRDSWGTAPAVTPEQQQLQLESCLHCH